MLSLEIIIGLLAAAIVLVRLARWLDLPPAVLLLTGGLLLSFVPAFSEIKLAPEVIFTLFLPPLLFYAAYLTSWRDFKDNARPIGLLAIGLVVATTLLVGFVAHWIVPDLPLAAAFVLGAIISPTDAIAATSVTSRIGVPRRVTTVIEGESLVNDASGLVVYRLGVAAVVSGTFSVFDAGWEFIWLTGGGILAGLTAAWLLVRLTDRMDDTPVENMIALCTPFVAYFAAENLLHASGVLSVVAAGLYFARHSPQISSSKTRLQGASFWKVLNFLFNNVLFLLVGLQLRQIVSGLGGITLGSALGYAAVVSFAVILIRIVWVYPTAYIPRFLSKRLRERDPAPDWQPLFVIAWAGMRGAISLAAAFSLPYTTQSGAELPHRELIIFIVFCVIFVTLVLQGITLTPLIRLLGLKDDGATIHEENEARIKVLEAGLLRIDELEKENEVPAKQIERLKEDYEYRIKAARTAAAQDDDSSRDYFRDEHRLRLEVINVERATIVALRKDGVIHDEAMRKIERDLDLEEQRLEGHHKLAEKSEELAQDNED